MALGLCAAFAATIPEWRRKPVRHRLETLVRQRGTRSRVDMRIRMTPTRGERSVAEARLRSSARDGARPGEPADPLAVGERGRSEELLSAGGGAGRALPERARAGRRAHHMVLDLDGTDDPTHGEQEGSAYHGYYRQHMYHPLLVFDGETHQLVTAVLQPANARQHRVEAVLKRVVRALRARWPGVRIEVRLDSGGAVRAIYDYCEQEGIPYTIGLIPNPRLTALAAPLAAEAQRQRAATGAEKVRLLSEVSYQAESRDRPRRVIVKAEALAKGPNTRFVVTTRTDEPDVLYAWYVDRGDGENAIKDLKVACFADRLSDHRFWANQFRLLLHTAAYCPRHAAPLVTRDARRADAAGHPASAPAQDRRTRLAACRPRPPAFSLKMATPSGSSWRLRCRSSVCV